MKNIKSLLAALLAAAMLLSLAACGKNSEDDPSNTPNNTDVPEYVYAAEYTTLQDKGERHMSVLCFTEDGFYARSYEKVGERELEEGEVLEYEGQLDLYEYRCFFMGYDGSLKQLDKYETAPPIEDTGEYDSFSSGSNISGLTVNEDGTLTVLESVYYSYYDGPKDLDSTSDEYWNHYTYGNEYYIRVLNADGSEISSAKAQLDGMELMLYSNRGLVVDSNGNLLISYYSASTQTGVNSFRMSEPGIVAVAQDGSVAYNISDVGYSDSIVKLADGRVGTIAWGQNGRELQIIDLEKGTLGESYSVPNDAYDIVPGGGDYDFYYTSGVNFYGYKLETEETEKLLNWISCDVDSNDMDGVYIRQDGTILGIVNDWSESAVSTYLVTVKQVPYESVPHKESLTLAVQYVDYQLRKQVINFNRNNDKYRVDIVDYSEYNTDGDYSAGITKLTTEILTGNVPDLVALNELPYTQMAAKGLLEDLYPYLDADPELSRDDFFESVLNAMETAGGLYQVCSSFTIQTVLGASSVVGEEPGWTYDELYAALETMPEGCDIFGYTTTQSDILSYCLYMDMDNLVDWTTGKCNFDSEDFIKILEFVGQFKSEFDWENYDYTEDSNTNRIAQGKQMLMPTTISDFHDVQINDLQFGGEGSSTYIGFPTLDGSSGSTIYLSSGIAMSAKCPNKEAAWEFLRSFLTEEYQATIWSLPTNKAQFMKELEEAATPRYRTDMNGNYMLDENGEKIEESWGGVSFGDGNSYEYYALTKTQVDKLTALVENTTKSIQYNTSIYDIVQTEAKAYFSGQKSAEEVARLIQSKANIYVNEQR